MLLSSCVVWRHCRVGGLPRRVPRRRSGAAAAHLGAARRRARLARLARRRAGVGGHREPAHDREAVRSARADRAARARRASSRRRCPTDAEPPLVLATGGFGKRLAAERGPAAARESVERRRRARLRDRARRAGDRRDGRVLRARDAGAAGADRARRTSSRCRSSTAAGRASTRDDGRDITPASVSWSENDLAQRIGPRAWYVLDDEGLEHARERVDAARAAGGTVVDPRELPFATPPGSRVAVHVAAAVTHTIGGIAIDTSGARARRRLRRGRRRGRRRDRRLRERARAGARARARRRGSARPR